MRLPSLQEIVELRKKQKQEQQINKEPLVPSNNIILRRIQENAPVNNKAQQTKSDFAKFKDNMLIQSTEPIQTNISKSNIFLDSLNEDIKTAKNEVRNSEIKLEKQRVDTLKNANVFDVLFNKNKFNEANQKTSELKNEVVDKKNKLGSLEVDKFVNTQKNYKTKTNPNFFDNLYENTIGSIDRGYSSSTRSQMIGKLLAKGDIENAVKLTNSKDPAEQYSKSNPNGLDTASRGAFNLIGQMAKQYTDSDTLSMAGIGAVAGNIPGAVSGFVVGSSMSNGEIEAGSSFEEMVKEGVNPETARNIALGVGAINAGIESLTFGTADKIYKLIDKAGLDDKIKNKLLSKIITTSAKSIVGTAGESAQETVQRGVTLAGSNLGKSMEGIETDSASDIVKDLGNEFVSSFISFGILTVPGVAKSVMQKTNSTEKDSIDINKLDNKQLQETISEVEEATGMNLKQFTEMQKEKLTSVNNDDKINSEVVQSGGTNPLFAEENDYIGGTETERYGTLSAEEETKRIETVKQEVTNDLKTRFNVEVKDLNLRKATSERENNISTFVKSATGVDIFFYDNKRLPAEFVSKTMPNAVFVRVEDENSKGYNDMQWAAGHGFIHTIKSQKPELYDRLKQAYNSIEITPQQTKKYLDLFSDNAEYQSQLKNNKELLVEEIIADEGANAFVDKTFWDRVYKYSKDLFTELLGVVEKIINNVSGIQYTTYADQLQSQKFRREFAKVMAEIRSDIANNKIKSNNDETNNKYSFVGEKAQLTREQQEKANWFTKPEDGKLRTEIADNKAKTKGLNLKIIGATKGKTNLASVLKHDELFRAYPQLRDITVRVQDLSRTGNAGYYNSKRNELVLDKSLLKDKEELRKTILHEVQHSIQNIEGFVNGTNPDYIEKKLVKVGLPNNSITRGIAEKKYISNLGEREANEVELRSKLTPKQIAKLGVPNYSARDKNPGIQGLEGYSNKNITDSVKLYIKDVLADNDIYDVKIKDIRVIGSRTKGTARKNSDLDVLVEYDGSIKEDDLFNILNEEKMTIEGIEVDINPIQDETIDQWIKRTDKMLKEEPVIKDSEGNQLSKEQQEYFKDSKVKDKEGNLLVMYHGTETGGFTRFEANKNKGAGKSLGDGYYFTPNKKLAENYAGTIKGIQKSAEILGLPKKENLNPQVYKVYLSIENPLYTGNKFKVSDNIIDKFIEKYIPTLDKTDIEYYNMQMSYLKSKFSNSVGMIDYIKSIANKKNILTSDILSELGYDGIIDGNEFVVFNSNQIKNVDNKKPTASDDIRYSDRNRISDFGEKIGGAKKDTWSKRGLEVRDVAEMNEAEVDKYVKKDNIWLKPDYKKLIADGIPQNIAFYIKTIRDTIDPRPVSYRSDTSTKEEKISKYINTVNEIKNAVNGIKSLDEAKQLFKNILLDPGYVRESTNGKYEITDKGKTNAVINNKLYQVLRYPHNEGNFKYYITDNSKEFGLEKEDVIRNKYMIQQKFDGTYFVSTKPNKYGMISAIAEGISTEENAKKLIDSLVEKELSTQVKTKGKKRLIPVQLENIVREGIDYRNDKNVEGKDYLDKFKFRGGEFGNWLNEKDRQVSLNYGYDSFLDLAKALEIKPEDISLGGDLAIAFGSRGSGNALAHYEPDRRVINLTKMNGAGSLGHEWGHALDDNIARKFGAKKLASTNISYINNEKIKKAYKNLVSAMKYNEVELTREDIQKSLFARNDRHKRVINNELFYLNKKFADNTKYKEILEKVLNGEFKAVDELNNFIKTETGRVIPKESRDNITNYSRFIDNDLDGYIKSLDITKKKEETTYYKNSQKLDEYNAKEGGYWQSSEEMYARAFSTYIKDKLGYKSDYLIGHAESIVDIDLDNNTVIKGYPENEERQRINEAFDELFKVLKEEGILHEQKYSDISKSNPTKLETLKNKLPLKNDLNNTEKVDSNNKYTKTIIPKVLYHGSPNSNIESLNIEFGGKNVMTEKGILYFTDNKEFADDFSYERIATSSEYIDKKGKKGRVYEASIDLKNPLDLTNLTEKMIDDLVNMDLNKIYTREMVIEYSKAMNGQLLKTAIDYDRQELKKYGYDGIIAWADKKKGIKEYGVLNNEQIHMKKEPLKVSKENYIDHNGGTLNSNVDMQKTSKYVSDSFQKRELKRRTEENQKISEARKKASEEYDEKVARGEIVRPTRIERLKEVAKGNSDRKDVQAARRLLDKEGIKWNDITTENTSKKQPSIIENKAFKNEGNDIVYPENTDEKGFQLKPDLNKLKRKIDVTKATKSELNKLSKEDLIQKLLDIQKPKQQVETLTRTKETLPSIYKTLKQSIYEVLGTNKNTYEKKQISNIVEKYIDRKNTLESNINNLDQLGFELFDYLDSKRIVNFIDEDISKVRQHLKDIKIKVSDDIKNDITDYNDFRKKLFGKVNLSSEGTSLDVIYQELSNKFPHIFKSDLVGGDQLQAISDILNTDSKSYMSKEEILENYVAPVILKVGENLTNEYGQTLPTLYENKLPNTQNNKMTVSKARTIVEEKTKNLINYIRKVRVSEETNKTTAKVKTELPQNEKTLKQKVVESKDSLIQAVVNRSHTVDELAKKTGRKILTYQYNNALQSRQASEYMLYERQTDVLGRDIGKSLKEVWKPVRDQGKQYTADFMDYLLHKHNVSRFIQGKPVFGENVSDIDSKIKVQEYERSHPEFIDYAKDVYTYNQNLLKYRVAGGLITKEQYEDLVKTYGYYVPTFRDITGTSGQFSGSNTVRINSTIKTAKGGTQDILPIDEIMARQTLQVVSAVRRNILGNTLLKVTEENPDIASEYIRTVEEVETDTTINEELPEVVKDKDKDKTNLFVIYKKGKTYEMQLNDLMFDSIKSMNGSGGYSVVEDNILYKTTVKLNSTFKKLVTGYNPLFIPVNVIRDIQDVFLYSKNLNEFRKAYPKAIKEILKNGSMWKKYKALGGFNSSFFDNEKGYRVKETKLQKYIDKIEFLNMALEQLPRFTEFMATVNKVGNDNYSTLLNGMYNAAEVTVNFGRSGKIGQFANKTIVPFINPGIQGTSKLYRLITSKKTAGEWLKLILKAGMFGIIPGIINELLLGDDDDYKELNDRDKDINYIIKNPFSDSEKFIRIPKGRVLSALAIPFQRSIRAIKGEEDPFKDMFDVMLGQTAPANPIENNLFSPILAMGTNKTWYGSDIESKRLQSKPVAERYDETTDELSKFIGKTLNVSPKKVNYLIKQYSGAIGQIGLPMMTPRAETNPLVNKFTIDPLFNNKLSSNFYDTLEKATQDKNKEKEDKNLPDGFATIKSLETSYLNKQSAKINDLYAEKRKIEMSKISDEDKRRTVRNLQAKIVDLQRNAIENYKTGRPSLELKYLKDSKSSKGIIKLFNDTGKESVLPIDYLDKTFTYKGTKYSLTDEEREKYSIEANKLLIPVYNNMGDNEGFNRLDTKTKEEVLSKLKSQTLDYLKNKYKAEAIVRIIKEAK